MLEKIARIDCASRNFSVFSKGCRTMSNDKADDQYSEAEAKKRFARLLRAALRTSPKPKKALPRKSKALRSSDAASDD
jgi:hypothetical protein